MWAPPFPPEEYDDYENEDGGMENQVTVQYVPPRVNVFVVCFGLV